MSAFRKQPSRLKTYSHLVRDRRMPSEYELVTSELLYYVDRGFEVSTPIKEWYAKYQSQSWLVSNDWERFADPRETTYAKYTDLAQAQEVYVDGIFQSIADGNYDRDLRESWRKTVDAALGPVRFPFHGFQMIAAYVGQMAPSGRITVAAAFQAADEVRRIQRVAQRTAQLRMVDPPADDGARDAWQNESAWQPLRELVERCLVAYDWGEALVALNLCVKPIFDELFMVELPRLAKSEGDFLLGQIFGSLGADCRWHNEWTIRVVETAIEDEASNREVIQSWIDKWVPLALRAAEPLERFGGGKGTVRTLHEALAKLLDHIGMEAPES